MKVQWFDGDARGQFDVIVQPENESELHKATTATKVINGLIDKIEKRGGWIRGERNDNAVALACSMHVLGFLSYREYKAALFRRFKNVLTASSLIDMEARLYNIDPYLERWSPNELAQIPMLDNYRKLQLPEWSDSFCCLYIDTRKIPDLVDEIDWGLVRAMKLDD